MAPEVQFMASQMCAPPQGVCREGQEKAYTHERLHNARRGLNGLAKDCTPFAFAEMRQEHGGEGPSTDNRIEGAELEAARAAAPPSGHAHRPQGQGHVVMALHAHGGAAARRAHHPRDADRRVDSQALRQGRRHEEERRGRAEVGRCRGLKGIPHPGVAAAELVGARVHVLSYKPNPRPAGHCGEKKNGSLRRDHRFAFDGRDDRI